ncbi:MAG TPA: signal peptidase I [Polyangia bacterium]|jgi:signal peptidase I|nr:signal peptidase I [Polyangia bacterium]
MSEMVGWWRQRSASRRARGEGQHLVKEARRILKKKGYRIPKEVLGEISVAADGVDAALRTDDLEALRKAITLLDEHMDQHLSFARKSTLREYSESIGVAVAVALLLRAFVVEAFQIPSGSMIPTLEVGDHIFVSKFAYGLSIPFTNTKILELRQPERGDVIVFKYPLDPGTDYIKRVVGLPGDVVEVRQETVYINGHAVPREHLPKPCHSSESGGGARDDCEYWVETLDGKPHETIQEPMRGGRDYNRTVVPPGNVFVMGDNRDNSSDSRVWGTVQHDLIKGKALIVWWSRANGDGWGLASWFKAIRWDRFFHVVR